MDAAPPASDLYLAWTTVADRSAAETLATEVVAGRLAACVQIDGPISSVYSWQGQVETATEFRLTFKCLGRQLPLLEQHILAHHSYDTPEWIVARAEYVGEKYLSWAEANSTNPPL